MVLLVPKGDKQWLENKGLGPAVEHTWWQSYTHETHEGPVTFTFLPAHHWSAQGVFDRNKSLWGSWMISFDGNDASIKAPKDERIGIRFITSRIQRGNLSRALSEGSRTFILPGILHIQIILIISHKNSLALALHLCQSLQKNLIPGCENLIWMHRKRCKPLLI